MRESGTTKLSIARWVCSDVAAPKPYPEIYTKAIEKLGVAPDAVLIVEDNQHGLEAARASQAHVHQVGGPQDVNWVGIEKAIARLERG